MKTKTQIVIVTGILITLVILLLASIHFKPTKQDFWADNWNTLFWTVVGIGALTLIVFGLKKLGASPSSWLPSWLKWLIAISIFIGVLLWIYYEWDLTKELGRDTVSTANKEVILEVILSDFQDKTPPPIPELKPGYYQVEFVPSKEEYSYTCPVGGGLGFGRPNSTNGYGSLLVRGTETDPAGNKGLLLIKSDDKLVHFKLFFSSQVDENAVKNCSAIIIGGLRVKVYLRPTETK